MGGWKIKTAYRWETFIAKHVGTRELFEAGNCKACLKKTSYLDIWYVKRYPVIARVGGGVSLSIEAPLINQISEVCPKCGHGYRWEPQKQLSEDNRIYYYIQKQYPR